MRISQMCEDREFLFDLIVKFVNSRYACSKDRELHPVIIYAKTTTGKNSFAFIIFTLHFSLFTTKRLYN